MGSLKLSDQQNTPDPTGSIHKKGRKKKFYPKTMILMRGIAFEEKNGPCSTTTKNHFSSFGWSNCLIIPRFPKALHCWCLHSSSSGHRSGIYLILISLAVILIEKCWTINFFFWNDIFRLHRRLGLPWTSLRFDQVINPLSLPLTMQLLIRHSFGSVENVEPTK